MSERHYSIKSRTGPIGVVTDLVRGFGMGSVWRSFAWDEIQNRYRRSVLGLAWIAFSYLFFVVVIVIFFKGLSKSDPDGFLYHVAIGYAAFTFLIANITDGCDVFRSATTWIKSTSLPYSIYIYKSISRSLFTFAIQMLVAVIVMFVVGWRPTLSILWAIPAFFIYLVNAVSIQLLCGLIATRYRDVSHLISTVTRLLFFMTPIIWTLDQRAGHVQTLALLNPLTHFIEIFRAPFEGVAPLAESWPIVLILTGVGWILAIVAGSFMTRRLPFWL